MTLKQGQFSQEQIIRILQEAQTGQRSLQTLCRQHNISQVTFYRWRKKYGGMSVQEAQRLEEREKENARLKRLRAQRDLERDVVKERLAKK